VGAAGGKLDSLGGPQPPTILFCLRVLLHLQRLGCRLDLQRAERDFRGIIYYTKIRIIIYTIKNFILFY
jgi:hypothetical protein